MPANKYPLKDGTNGPGVTTICNQLGKGDGIPNWSHKVAYDSTVRLIKEYYTEFDSLVIPKYEDIQKWQDVRDSAGDIGTLVHGLIHKWIADFWQRQILGKKRNRASRSFLASNNATPQSSNCFMRFLNWFDGDKVNPYLAEKPFVSEQLKFGGMPDIVALVNDKHRLIDIKTGGKWVYDDWWLQLAGYDILLRENGYKVDEYQILWLPKDGRFDCPIRTDLRNEKIIFKHLLGIYKARKITNSPPW